jgi:iron complex outermembrane receptor protein
MLMNWKLTGLRKCMLTLFALFIGIGVLMAQEVRITGTVTSSEDGASLPGVSVVRKGTTTGTTTDMDGKYSISVPRGSVLVFSFIGMQSHEMTVENATIYDVILKTETTGINEVVVTALGIKRDKKALGYSISSIKSDEIGRASCRERV